MDICRPYTSKRLSEYKCICPDNITVIIKYYGSYEFKTKDETRTEGRYYFLYNKKQLFAVCHWHHEERYMDDWNVWVAYHFDDPDYSEYMREYADDLKRF